MSLVQKRKKARNFLTNIRPSGAAGTIAPAHEHPGWVIMKSANANQDVEGVQMEQELADKMNELILKADEFARQHAGLVAALEAAEEYLSELPANAQTAAVTLFDTLDVIERGATEAEKNEIVQVQNAEAARATATRK